MYIFVFGGCACNRIFSEFFPYFEKSHGASDVLQGGKTVNSELQW